MHINLKNEFYKHYWIVHPYLLIIVYYKFLIIFLPILHDVYFCACVICIVLHAYFFEYHFKRVASSLTWVPRGTVMLKMSSVWKWLNAVTVLYHALLIPVSKPSIPIQSMMRWFYYVYFSLSLLWIMHNTII